MDKFVRKTGFYLMTEKGFFVLQSFLRDFDKQNVEAVVIGRDKNVVNDYSEKIKKLCEQTNISYYYRQDEYQFKANVIFAISWRWIIKDFENIIVLHDSLLPKYRGFAPLVNCLINGEKKVGVTALNASESYDCGDIIAQKELNIDYPIKIYDAIQRISPLYYELIKDIAEIYFSGKELNSYPQDNSKATYSLWRDKSDYRIDWSEAADKIRRFIDAVSYPYEGAYTYVEKHKVIITDAEVFEDVTIENRQPGKIIFMDDNNPVVVCGKGLLKIKHMVTEENTQKNPFTLQKFRSRFV